MSALDRQQVKCGRAACDRAIVVPAGCDPTDNWSCLECDAATARECGDRRPLRDVVVELRRSDIESALERAERR